jgi:arylsulfatase A-like enzyme
MRRTRRALASCAALVCLFVLVPAAAGAAKPNVIVVLTDDQRWDTLKYMPTVRKQLVDKGVTFSNSFVVDPLCCPSRASILTGDYSHTTGVWRNGAPDGGFRSFRDRNTLATRLDAAGYRTALIGKYLNNYDDSTAFQWYVPPGWDKWFAFWGEKGYFGYEVDDNGLIEDYGWDPADYSTDVLANEAFRFIQDSGKKPFFLYFAPKAPHVTNGQESLFRADPAPRDENAFRGFEPFMPPSVNERDVGDKPRYIRSLPQVSLNALAELRRTQLASLLDVDRAVGGMLALLRKEGKLKNTIIVFTSDNGYSWGEHRRLTKLVPYEESIRVPLVIRYDRVIERARSDPRFALNIDLAPTIVDAAGLSPHGFEGRSLVPFLAGRSSPGRRSFLIEQGARGEVPPYCGFRSRRWKYVQYATGEEEVYHLSRDPYELTNLAGRPGMQDALRSYRERVIRSPCRPPGFRPLAPGAR